MKQHEILLSISKNKTEQIKLGDMDELSKLLMKERKQIQVIAQLEEERQQLVEQIFTNLMIEEEQKTVTNLLNYLEDGEEKEALLQIVTNLVEVITVLKENEQLNEQLIEQSMQFVQLSLDMLQPSMQQINYHDKKQENKSAKRSVFDSKA